MIRALFCGGSPKAGSWQIRGEQIAACRPEWTAAHNPTDEQIETAQVAVLVKRAPPLLVERLRQAKKPVIWDALDFWRQPEEALGIDTIAAARVLAGKYSADIRPQAILAANKAMTDDLRGMAPIVEGIYHHYDPLLQPVKNGNIIGYEGHATYPAHWIGLIAGAARKIGWKFELGRPGPATQALFAMRAYPHGSWLARRWKSNVKAANAIALGVPFIAWPEDAYVETLPGEMGWWFSTEKQLGLLVERLLSKEWRQAARTCADLLRPRFHVANAAKAYELLFLKVL